ncbi:hypothetical protein Aau02nite_78490 [Amorphoplanes auranticolor]|uniref:DUF4878 domain-containing protein n=1 Tax=Actinoplanes auranticolor TaxID=47988 RepID=A0A919SV49_9ACTN|nr:hypothetical protein Aau02nite_78490 [Actinoplanes auranticolor]
MIDNPYRGAVTSYPPPAFAPAPPPPRKRRTWLIVLATVGVLTVLVCALGLGRLFFRLKHVTDVEKEIERTTAAFIEDRRDGLSQAGYDGLCAEAKDEFRLEDLAKPPEEAVTDFKVFHTNVAYERGQATVSVDVQRPDGTREKEVYILDEDGERWKMCSFPA